MKWKINWIGYNVELFLEVGFKGSGLLNALSSICTSILEFVSGFIWNLTILDVLVGFGLQIYYLLLPLTNVADVFPYKHFFTQTVDQFFDLKVPMRPTELSGLFRGVDNAFQVFANHVIDKLGMCYLWVVQFWTGRHDIHVLSQLWKTSWGSFKIILSQAMFPLLYSRTYSLGNSCLSGLLENWPVDNFIDGY